MLTGVKRRSKRVELGASARCQVPGARCQATCSDQADHHVTCRASCQCTGTHTHHNHESGSTVPSSDRPDTVTMSLDAPAYIVSLQNNIRARPISWEGAVRAKTITDEDLKKIKAIDKVRKEQRKATIEGDVQTYTDLLLGNAEDTRSIFASAAKRPDILQYMLVLTGDLVDGMRQFNHELRYQRN